MKLTMAKFGAVALLATTAACSCIDAPELDVAPVAVEKKYEASATPMVEAAPKRIVSGKKIEKPMMAMPLNKVFFDYDSAALTPAAQNALKDIAAYAKHHNVQSFTVEGHADERGTREYNLALGDRRAVAAKRYLASLGLDASKMTTVSYGKERPAVQGHTESCMGTKPPQRCCDEVSFIPAFKKEP